MNTSLIRNMIKIAFVFVLSTLVGCGPEPSEVRPYRNFTDNHIANLDGFIDDFPLTTYQIHQVPGLGSMYLDNIGDYIKEMLKEGRTWEPEHVVLMEKYAKPGSTIVDLGAHIGTISIPASRIVGGSGRVISFEPQPKIFRELNQNIMLNGIKNIETYRLAIGEQAGVVRLKTLAPGNEGGTSIDRETTENGYSADVVNLDSFNLTNVSVMKIDVEGWEDAALRGAKETIMRNRPVILIEIMGGTNYERAPQGVKDRIDATKALLTSYGYELSLFEGGLDYVAVPKKGVRPDQTRFPAKSKSKKHRGNGLSSFADRRNIA